MALREILKRNSSTCNDANLYFVDRDFDDSPSPDEFLDVYVTDGYSIENEVVTWGAVEGFIRAFFDLADADDFDAVEVQQAAFEERFAQYLECSELLQRTLYSCRRNSIVCMPEDGIQKYLVVDWAGGRVGPAYSDLQDLLNRLRIPPDMQASVGVLMASPDPVFSSLDRYVRWRGKFHLAFVRSFLIALREARLGGSAPFKRASRVDAEPSHPSLLAHLAAHVPPPASLVAFLQRNTTASV
jgi:hypothetical protein